MHDSLVSMSGQGKWYVIAGDFGKGVARRKGG